MSDIAKDNILKSKALLEKLDKGTVGMDTAGGNEHQSGGFGQVKAIKTKEKNKFLPESSHNEEGFKRKFNHETGKEIAKESEPGTQQGFGTTGSSKPIKLRNASKNIKNMPSDISDEKTMQRAIDKAFYEYVSGGRSYTDESEPKDDSFYLPSKVVEDTNDTSKKAKEKHEKTKFDERINNNGAAVKRQQLNTGNIESSNIG